MKCPYFDGIEFDSDGTCKNCKNYDNCKQQYEEQFMPKITGDNCPNYATIHLRLLMNKTRRNLIEKLLATNLPPITKNDIMDMIIDLEIYNNKCKPVKKRKSWF